MIGQTFTLIGNPKLVFRLVWRGSIAGIDCVRGVALNGEIPDHEARHRRRVCRGRLVDPAIERPFANLHAPPLRHLPASRLRTLRLSRIRQGDGRAAPACCERAAAAHAHDR